MSFVIDDAFLPATLTAAPMTDEEFASFCAGHPDLFFEMTAEGEIIVMPPTYSMTSARNSEIDTFLRVWAAEDGRGIVCDSSGGFVLPNGARRSPDASWTLKSRILQLDPESRSRFCAPLSRLRRRTSFTLRSAANPQREDAGVCG